MNAFIQQLGNILKVREAALAQKRQIELNGGYLVDGTVHYTDFWKPCERYAEDNIPF